MQKSCDRGPVHIQCIRYFSREQKKIERLIFGGYFQKNNNRISEWKLQREKNR